MRRLRIDARILVLAASALLIAAAFALLRPDVFLTPLNMNSMLLQSSVIGLLSLAVAIAMLTGGIDLSVNATANLTAIVVALFLGAFAPANEGAHALATTVGALIAGLLAGAGCGLFNGVLVGLLGYSPILATLGTMTLYAGIGTVLTGGATLFGVSAFVEIGRGSVFDIPVPSIIFLFTALVLALVLEARRFGFAIYLFGANEKAARYSGVNTRRVVLGVYVVSGLLSAVAGLINLGVTNSANVDFGSSYVLLAILVCVLGGVSPSGGAGKVAGVVLAVLLLQFLSTGLNMVFQSSGSNFLKDFAWGLTLLIVLALDRLRGSRIRFAIARQKHNVAAKPADAVRT
jgi:simple sugar transport system permease protein